CVCVPLVLLSLWGSEFPTRIVKLGKYSQVGTFRQYPQGKRQVLAADKRKRENHEEQRNEFENYAEEEQDEQDERTRESTEQWREFHYDGLHPPHEYNRQST
uniref:Unique cartilage matrix-associated protein n=1 Tax=Hucho hucho TaxID=62062 RepID=A0A4W5QDS8_9TELE